MANLSGTLNIFRALVQPRLIIPSVTVKSIRGLDFHALKRAGYVGAVFDKDNCLTLPHEDYLVSDLNDAWRECKEVFGRDNVLIVSNSAGTQNDAGLIHAESVSHHLGVPVLAHATKKPGCIKPIQKYFQDLPRQDHASSTAKIIVVGDRLFTDVLMANRLGHDALGVWTTGLWIKESMFLRRLEKAFLDVVLKYRGRRGLHEADLSLQFTKPEPLPPAPTLAPPPPRQWYVQYPISAVQLTWSGARSLVARAREGKEVKLARAERRKEVDRILQADPGRPEKTSIFSMQNISKLTRTSRS